jgi:predicted nuclease of restriction endonuclease-like (RecB) superfamily
MKPVIKRAVLKLAPGATALPSGYGVVRNGIVGLVNSARQAAARNVNSLMTASYWEIGRRIVEAEQKGKRRAGYGEQLIERLSIDLTQQFGRGFSRQNLQQMRLFFEIWSVEQIRQTLSGKLPKQHLLSLGAKTQIASAQLTVSRNASATLSQFDLADLANAFPLPWSAYVRLLSVKDNYARQFYKTEALRGGWSVRQLDRQIGSQFYERTALSKNKAAMLNKGEIAKPEDTISPDEAVKDPYVLEFLNLKDEYSESELEAALIHRLEDFLLELGSDFTFAGRQRRRKRQQCKSAVSE